MITRRNLVLASVLTAACAAAGAARADDAAKAFLEKIYAAYKGKNSKGILIDTDARVRLYFEPKLAALMIKDMNAAQKRGEPPELDGDPFVGAQDWEIGPVVITVQDLGPGKATATAKFSNIKEPKTVTYDLVKLAGGWRIADINWGDNDTLRGLYVKK
jgi:Protein of unknown function (DUF3828)